jgi:transposase
LDSKAKIETVNIYFQDESRFGLMTRSKRMLTKRGVKPVMDYQHKFETQYLFGAFSPVNGDQCLLLLPRCNSDMFQIFLDQMAAQKPTEHKILILDNGAFHKAQKLNIPTNMTLLFLPPYSPELNPAEKIWRILKDETAMTIHKNIAQLDKHISKAIEKRLTEDAVMSICGDPFYLQVFKSIFNV